jgi:hypothetical protein
MIAGANANWYLATDAGSYRIQVIDGNCSTMSDSIKVTKEGSSPTIVKPIVDIDGSNYLCTGNGTVQLKVNNQSAYTNATYQWFNDTGMVQQGASGVLYVNTDGQYYVQVLQGGCSAVSDIDTIRMGVNNIPEAFISSNTSTICGDTGVALLSLITTYTNASYQWYRNYTLIAGATDKIYLATESGVYRIRVTLQNGCITYSASITILKQAGGNTIPKPLTDLMPPDGVIRTSGDSVEITVSNTGSFNNPTYVWYNGTDSAGSGSVYYASSAGVYFVLVQNNNGCSSVSDSVTITLNPGVTPKPNISSNPSSDTICSTTGSVVLTVTNVSDYVAPQYQWYRYTDTIPGAHASVYIATDSGIYTVIVTDTGGPSGLSNAIHIYKVQGGSVLTVPDLVSSSLTNTICGDTGSFILTVDNASLSYSPQAIYRWYKGTEVVQNGTTPTYVVRDEGVYWVYVIDGGCSVVSDNDTVTLSVANNIPKPKIASLSGTTVCGQYGTITLSLTNNAGDYTNATYTWYRNDSLLSGETNAVLHVTEAGYYRIQVMEGSCTALSDSLLITKDPAGTVTEPNLASSPLGAALCGDTGVVYLSVTNNAAYTSSPVYRWFRNDTLITGVSTWYHYATAVGVYKVEVDNGGCTSLSNPDTVVSSGSQNIPKAIVRYESTTAEICGVYGSVIMTLSNSTAYATTATYQWYKDGVAITGGTDSMYIATDTGYYRLQIVDGSCSTFSDSIHVTKNSGAISRPSIISSSPSLALCNGGTILLTENSGNTYDRYIWYKGTVVVQDGTDSTYELSSAGTYFVQAINGNCAAVSDSLTITTSGTQITQPAIQSVSGATVLCGTGTSIMLELTNASIYGSSAQIQWYNGNTPLQGETGIYYEATVAGLYKVHVLASGCGAFSDTLRVTYDNNGSIQQPKLTNIPNNQKICAMGGTVLLSVDSASYLYPSARFVWYKDNIKVQDSTLSEYMATDSGVYYVQVITGGCSSRSESDTIIEQTGNITTPVIVSVSGGLNLCDSSAGIVLKLDEAISYPSGTTYQWYKDGVAIAGATAWAYTATDSGSYRLEVRDGSSCFSVSNALQVIIPSSSGSITKPNLASNPQTDTLCVGGSVYYSVTNPPQNGQYHWYRNDTLIQNRTLS